MKPPGHVRDGDPPDRMSKLRDFWRRIDEGRVLGIAAEMSFWLFLAIVPLAAVAGMVVAKLALGNSLLMSDAMSALPDVARDLLVKQVSAVATWRSGKVAPMAVVVFLWLASSGMHSVFDAMEIETGRGRPWWKQRLIALGACAVMPFGVGIIVLLGTGLDWISEVTGKITPFAAQAIHSGPVSVVARVVGGGLVFFVLVVALFVVGVPRDERRDMPVVPGALLVVLLQTVCGFGYASYVAKTGTGDAYEAGLAAVGIVLMALYFLSTSILAGLTLNVMLRDERRAATHRNERTGGSKGSDVGSGSGFRSLSARRG